MGFFDEYPYTNWHNVNLDWVLERVKEWGQTVDANNQAFQNLEAANASFKAYVENYLQDLDVQDAINIKLDEMLSTGVLAEYLQPYVSETVTDWLEEHITQPEEVVIDSSLTVAGAAADAKATGDAIEDLRSYILSDSIKNNILALFRKVLYKDETGGNEYLNLYSSFFGDTQPINAYDIMSIKGFTFGESIGSDGKITFSNMVNGAVLAFSPDNTNIVGNIAYSNPTYETGRLFVFRIVSNTTFYAILTRNLIILEYNAETGIYNITIDNTIANLNVVSSDGRGSQFIDLRLNNNILYGYKKDGTLDFTVDNANCIGFWGNNNTGIPTATFKRNTMISRKLRIEDIDTANGYSGLTVNDGNVSVTSQNTFSAIVLNNYSIRSRLSFNYSTVRYANLIVYRKNADGSLFGMCGATPYLFTYIPDENRYRASTMENENIIVRPDGDRTGGFFHAVLKDNTLYIFNAQMGLLYLINNANCIGIYSADISGELNTFDCEVRIYD